MSSQGTNSQKYFHHKHIKMKMSNLAGYKHLSTQFLSARTRLLHLSTDKGWNNSLGNRLQMNYSKNLASFKIYKNV